MLSLRRKYTRVWTRWIATSSNTGLLTLSRAIPILLLYDYLEERKISIRMHTVSLPYL